MAKFTDLELELFAEHTCAHCFQTDEAAKRAGLPNRGCALLERARGRGQMPGRWTRRRNAPLGSTFKCEDFTAQPASIARKTAAPQTESLFGDAEVTPAQRLLTPVEGWPDYRAQAAATKDGDHQ